MLVIGLLARFRRLDLPVLAIEGVQLGKLIRVKLDFLAIGSRGIDEALYFAADTGFANQVQNFGLAAAASVLLGGVLLVLTLLQLKVGQRRERGLEAIRNEGLRRRLCFS